MLVKPGSAVFAEVPEGSGCYQPSEQASVQDDAIDVSVMFWTLGVIVAKAMASRACFPVRFTKCAFRSSAACSLLLYRMVGCYGGGASLNTRFVCTSHCTVQVVFEADAG